MLVRPLVPRGGLPASRVASGDLVAGGESISAGAITTAGAGTWTGAAIATGIIRRSGPVGGYTDTTDTSSNILAALTGNYSDTDAIAGNTFRLLFQNTVAQAMTFAAGTGVIAGTGTLNCAASLVREYLVTILNASPPTAKQANTTNGSAVVTFVLASGQSALTIGPNSQTNNITVGMTISGTGITAGTTVAGLTMGQGGLTGITMSANATATSSSGGVQLSFLPTVQFDSLFAGTA